MAETPSAPESAPSRPNRWLVLASCLLLLIVAGGVYGFGTLAADLKTDLGISEDQKEFIGVAGNLGLWTGSALGGALADRYGASNTLRGAAVLLAAGYTIMYRALLGPEEAWVSGYTAGAGWFLVGQGSGWVYNSSLFCAARNFGERSRAYVLGMAAMAFGMASTMWATLLHGCTGGGVQAGSDGYSCDAGFPNSDVKEYMLAMALGMPLLVCALSLGTKRLSSAQVEAAEAEEDSGLHLGVCVLAETGLLLYVVACNATRLMAEGELGQARLQVADFPIMAGLVAAWFLLVAFPCSRTLKLTLAPMPTQPAPPAPAAPGGVGGLREAASMEEYWLMVLIVGCCVGGNVTVLNNLTTIVKDRDDGTWSDPEQAGNMAVIVAMAVSASARLGVGVSMYRLPHIPKGHYLVAAALFGTAAQLSLCLEPNQLVFGGCALLGVSDGCLWTAAPWVVGKVFGMRNAGGVFGSIVCAAAVLVVLLSYVIEPAVYNAHKQGSECHGIQCFRATHLVCAALGVAAVPTCLRLHCKLQAKGPHCVVEEPELESGLLQSQANTGSEACDEHRERMKDDESQMSP